MKNEGLILRTDVGEPIAVGAWRDGTIYQMGECRIILSGVTERSQIGWHFSISCVDRYPTWEEMKVARYALVPDNVYMVMILPPKADYLNVHPNCFHWHQMHSREPWI